MAMFLGVARYGLKEAVSSTYGKRFTARRVVLEAEQPAEVDSTVEAMGSRRRHGVDSAKA